MTNEGDAGEMLSPAQTAILVGFTRALLPHPALGEAPYERAVSALVASAERSPALAHHVLSLVAEASSRQEPAGEPTPEEWTAFVAELSGDAFFPVLRGNLVTVFYADPEVREFIGYPGPAYDLGGYLHRGFDDLDWLPEPRIAESHAAFTEVVEAR